ncbi:MAG TPA: DUF72 domain-containing protein [Fimbriimonadaceae bacterium]|nr:DUF72 domain-containing protein [Fimbriimonadaceae bacterium]
MDAKAYIGTSGWIYNHWKNTWYAGVPRKAWLQHMTERMTALEANGTFYRLPTKESLAAWKEATPADFRFTMKAHRYLTHRKRLKDIAEGIGKQKEAAAGLGEKLSCVVWQLPSNFKRNDERLESFLEELKAWPETRHSIELRHESWFVPEVADRLTEAGVAVCMSDAAGWPMWQAVTTDLVYVRLHGHHYTYWSNYSEADLSWWADRVRLWLEEGREVHVYFDNDANSHAPYNAERLLALVGGG